MIWTCARPGSTIRSSISNTTLFRRARICSTAAPTCSLHDMRQMTSTSAPHNSLQTVRQFISAHPGDGAAIGGGGRRVSFNAVLMPGGVRLS